MPSHRDPSVRSTTTRNSDFKEENIDKFATLFQPSTPRASPTLDPIFDIPPSRETKPAVRQSHLNRRASTSSDSEFGSFVSVPATEDPLSSGIPKFEFDRLPSPLQASQVFTHPPNHVQVASPSIHPLDNNSLNFFDKFAHDAKKASEKNRRDVLEELLMHDEEPLYWLKDSSNQIQKLNPILVEHAGNVGNTHESGTLQKEGENLIGENTDILSNNQTRDLIGDSDTRDSLDLDHDFFSSRVPSAAGKSSPPLIESSSPRLTRSPTMTAPVTLAPPVASTPIISSQNQSPLSTPTPDTDVNINSSRSSSPENAQTFSTLSSLSSRWMSSLFSSNKPQAVAAASTIYHGARPALESIFSQSTTLPKSSSPPSSSSSSPSHRGRQLSRNSQGTPATSHVSLPPSNSGSIFGPPTVTHVVSPFASHTYTPPSGAPGFQGEGYDWDKGFSSELEQELMLREDKGVNRKLGGKTRKTPGDEMYGNVGGVGVGELIERKITVHLKGRKAATTPVLDADLANQIRPYLPALARLPKNWNLIYSLDQDGISLNTLYTRCEAQAQTKPGVEKTKGVLIVLKDSGSGLFGVWMAEGLRTSKGKGYYGTGESFMWKYSGGELKVFKWTGKNDYVALCEPEYISFGGGDGKYGLYLDDALDEGSTAPCPTFGNEPLCSPGPMKAGAVVFECVGLEVWGVGP